MSFLSSIRDIHHIAGYPYGVRGAGLADQGVSLQMIPLTRGIVPRRATALVSIRPEQST